MTPSAHSGHRSSGVRALLLVLAVTAGLLAMHGLTPAPAMGAHTAVSAPSAHAMADDTPRCVRPGHDNGGHTDHADTTCAAAGTSTGPVLSLPFVSGQAYGAGDPAVTPGRVAGATPGKRAPPSLSELQLLRI